MKVAVAPTQARLAAWGDRRLMPGVLVLLLVTDLLVGANWLFSPEANLTSPAYDVAKMVAPMHVWGTIFSGAAALTILALATMCSRWITGYLVGPVMGGLWVLWTVLFTLAPIGREGASYLGALLAACLAGLHLLIGLAVNHRRCDQK